MTEPSIPEPGPPLPDEVLARRALLPQKPDVGEVRTARTIVRPYDRADAAELHAISNGEPVTRLGRSVDAYDPDALVWRFMHAGPFAGPDELHALHAHFAGLPDAACSTVVDAATGELLGSVTLLANVPGELRVEIGNVWATPAVQGLGVIREVTLALADVLFALGYRRYEWKCNDRNLRSRQTAEAMGFRYEGTFRAHMVVKGRRRDTAWFSLLPDDPR